MMSHMVLTPDSRLVADLADAGLLFREVVPVVDRLVPISVALYMGYLLPAEGRMGVLIRHDEPDLCARINEEWERLALENGLFANDGEAGPEFLIGLNLAGTDLKEEEREVYRWVRVRLAPEWDLAGVGCASGVLGAGAGNPTFLMASSDGEVLMKSGYYQDGIDISVLGHPGRNPRLREQARRLVSSVHLESEQRDWVEAWLAGLSRGPDDA